MSDCSPAPSGGRIQRSELAVPATSERFIAKAAASDADSLFLDLEDAVAPDAKQAARDKAILALNTIDWGRKIVSVRVNGLDTPWGLRDILEVSQHCPRLDMILLPKTSSAFDVRFVDQLLTGIEREQGRERRVGIEVLIETAKGVANVEEIAAASPRLEGMIFGVGDYTIDMRTYDFVFGKPSPNYQIPGERDGDGPAAACLNDQWHFALARIANACRANNLRPIDGPYADFGDPQGYRAAALRAAALGFEGKWAIHPSQIALANEVFTPDAHQLEWARRIETAIAASTASGQGATSINGVLIDMAHVKLASAILQRARRIAGLEAGEATT